jgi:hypothetical protein
MREHKNKNMGCGWIAIFSSSSNSTNILLFLLPHKFSLRKTNQLSIIYWPFPNWTLINPIKLSKNHKKVDRNLLEIRQNGKTIFRINLYRFRKMALNCSLILEKKLIN